MSDLIEWGESFETYSSELCNQARALRCGISSRLDGALRTCQFQRLLKKVQEMRGVEDELSVHLNTPFPARNHIDMSTIINTHIHISRLYPNPSLTTSPTTLDRNKDLHTIQLLLLLLFIAMT